MIKSDIEHWDSVDKRIIENKLKRGKLSEKDFNEYLRKLPDISGYTDKINIDPEKDGVL